jgi:hypothetical protein
MHCWATMKVSRGCLLVVALLLLGVNGDARADRVELTWQAYSAAPPERPPHQLWTEFNETIQGRLLPFKAGREHEMRFETRKWELDLLGPTTHQRRNVWVWGLHARLVGRFYGHAGLGLERTIIEDMADWDPEQDTAWQLVHSVGASVRLEDRGTTQVDLGFELATLADGTVDRWMATFTVRSR